MWTYSLPFDVPPVAPTATYYVTVTAVEPEIVWLAVPARVMLVPLIAVIGSPSSVALWMSYFFPQGDERHLNDIFFFRFHTLVMLFLCIRHKLLAFINYIHLFLCFVIKLF